MAETLAIIPLWYGMVWCGGAEQIPAFAWFNIHVGTKQSCKCRRN